MKNYADILFVNEVRDLQDQDGTGARYASAYSQQTREHFSEAELGFIATRESFYMATVSSTGWPYVQHRGGPRGFLKVTAKNQLGFADYLGNRQFISMGHAAHDQRVALFLMDYQYGARLKMLGHLQMIPVSEADTALVQFLNTPGQGRVDRIATIDVIAIDWNCSQYIPQLISVKVAQAAWDQQINLLKAENEALKNELRHYKKSS